jgi:hypothetical protein
MRALFLLLISVGVVAIHLVDDPPWIQRIERPIINGLVDIVFSKDVRVSASGPYEIEQLQKLLPKTRSNPWWLLNTEVIRAKLREDPRVASATVAPCPGSPFFRWGCFDVNVIPKEPRYSVEMDGTTWAVGDDGAFIAPLTNLPGVTSGELVRIDFSAQVARSPDIVRAMMGVARELLGVMERETGLKLTRIALGPDREAEMNFRELPFPVIVQVSGVGKVGAVSTAEQARRLQALLPQLAGRASEVEAIDLAFDRLGVVRLKAPPSGARQK